MPCRTRKIVQDCWSFFSTAPLKKLTWKRCTMSLKASRMLGYPPRTSHRASTIRLTTTTRQYTLSTGTKYCPNQRTNSTSKPSGVVSWARKDKCYLWPMMMLISVSLSHSSPENQADTWFKFFRCSTKTIAFIRLTRWTIKCCSISLFVCSFSLSSLPGFLIRCFFLSSLPLLLCESILVLFIELFLIFVTDLVFVYFCVVSVPHPHFLFSVVPQLLADGVAQQIEDLHTSQYATQWVQFAYLVVTQV